MNTGFLEALRKILQEDQCITGESMGSHTTFRVGGPADYYVRPRVSQVPQVLAACREYGIPWMVIGNGSNLLVGDKGIRGLVLEMGKWSGSITVEGTRVKAEAGAMLAAAARQAAREGLAGMEFASGIPGTVGGAVVMNAGAYGDEMKDIVVQASVLTPEGEVRTLDREALQLGYRHSCIPERNYLVLSAELELIRGDRDQIEARMEELRGLRVGKQPLEYPSAGSTFKRPEGYFAGQLIQDAGLRGYQTGGAQVSEKHCGFVINKDQATAEDIRRLIQEVQRQVAAKSGVKLEPEVKFIGEF